MAWIQAELLENLAERHIFELSEFSYFDRDLQFNVRLKKNNVFNILQFGPKSRYFEIFDEFWYGNHGFHRYDSPQEIDSSIYKY